MFSLGPFSLAGCSAFFCLFAFSNFYFFAIFCQFLPFLCNSMCNCTFINKVVMYKILGLALNIYGKFQNSPSPHTFQNFWGEACYVLFILFLSALTSRTLHRTTSGIALTSPSTSFREPSLLRCSRWTWE